jgi:hypothetical protein
MYPMPITEARQLVAERRASYEAIAFRRHFRRFVSRPAAPVAASGTLTAQRSAVTTVARHHEAPVSKVA